MPPVSPYYLSPTAREFLRREAQFIRNRLRLMRALRNLGRPL